MGSSTVAQVDKQERAAEQDRACGGEGLREEGEQETPGMQRNTAWAGGTLQHQEIMGTLHTTDQGHSQELIWFINLVPQRKTRAKARSALTEGTLSCSHRVGSSFPPEGWRARASSHTAGKDGGDLGCESGAEKRCQQEEQAPL